MRRRVRAALRRADPRVWPRLTAGRASGSRTWPPPRRPRGRTRRFAGGDLGRVLTVAPAAIAVVDGRIAAVGTPGDVRAAHPDLEPVDGRGRVAIPGLIDCHTHPAFGGDRANEFDLRAQGADYERIHASGGGIAATVAATRALDAPGYADRRRAAHGLDGRARDDDGRGQVRLRARPRHRAAQPRGGRCGRGDRDGADLAGRAQRAAGVRRRRRVPRLRPGRGPARRCEGGRGGGCVPRAGRVLGRAGGALSTGGGGPWARATAARRPVHRVRRDPACNRARRAFGRPSRGDRRRPASTCWR